MTRQDVPPKKRSERESLLNLLAVGANPGVVVVGVAVSKTVDKL